MEAPFCLILAMKPFIEKPPLTKEHSFLAKTYRTPHFEIPWHQHIEYELILFTEGEGLIFMGSYVGDFKPGDIFFIGSNLPHTFQKASAGMIVNAVVIQFRNDFWGEQLLALPESKQIRKVLEIAANGIRVSPSQAALLAVPMQSLEHATGFERILGLCNCLQVLSGDRKMQSLSAPTHLSFNEKKKERIDRIFQYTIDHFQETITLQEIAGYASMSVPAFCTYFKKCAKKPYISFLNEVRIGFAASQLADTQKSIESICYESGYNSITHFNRQFKRIKKMNPSAYRKKFSNSLI